MTVEVMSRIPGDKEGLAGEVRLIITGNGMFLYVKGHNHWGILKLSNARALLQIDRNTRTAEQRKIRQVIQVGETTAAEHGEGTITGGGHGGNNGGGPPPDMPG